MGWTVCRADPRCAGLSVSVRRDMAGPRSSAASAGPITRSRTERPDGRAAKEWSHEGCVVLRRSGPSTTGLLRQYPQAPGDDRLQADPVAPNEILCPLWA